MTNDTDTKKPKTADIIRQLAEQNDGTLTPEIVLDEARKKTSPLHKLFTWDNHKAAEQYRLIEAARLIRRIKVTIPAGDDTPIRVRAFVNVNPIRGEEETPEEEGRGIYVTMQHASSVTNYHDQMIQACKRDVEAFRRKYSVLSEAARIIKAMDHFDAEFSID